MSLYLPHSQAYFLHIPRTGGNWIERALRVSKISYVRRLEHRLVPPKRRHSPLLHLTIGSLNRIKLVFGFVRHPLSYYESAWRWYSKGGRRIRSWATLPGKREWSPIRDVMQYHLPDFNEWVLAVVKNEPAWVTRLYETFIGPEDGEYCVFIGRTETLVVDFCKIMRYLGYGKLIDASEEELKQISPMNKSVYPKPTWIPEVREAVERAEVVAIRRFYGEASKHNRWTWLVQ